MPRISGIVGADGSLLDDTSNKSGFSIGGVYSDVAGKYRIEFNDYFTYAPTVLANVILEDLDNDDGPVQINIQPNQYVTDISFTRNGKLVPVSFSFVAYGDLVEA